MQANPPPPEFHEDIFESKSIDVQGLPGLRRKLEIDSECTARDSDRTRGRSAYYIFALPADNRS